MYVAFALTFTDDEALPTLVVPLYHPKVVYPVHGVIVGRVTALVVAVF